MTVAAMLLVPGGCAWLGGSHGGSGGRGGGAEAGAASGDATTGSARRTSPSVLVRDRVVYATPGVPAVLLLDVPAGLAPPAEIPVEIGAGEVGGEVRLVGRCVRVSSEARPVVTPADPRVDALSRWLGPTRDWTATDADGLIPFAPGLWVLRLDLPEPVADARPARLRLRADRPGIDPGDATGRDAPRPGWTTLPIVWLDPAPHAWAPAVVAETERRRWIASSAAVESASPLTWWRAQLLRARGSIGASDEPPFADPTLEALAMTRSARVRAALDRLASQDPALAERIAIRLTAHIGAGERAFLPAWIGVDADALIDEVLDPLVTDERAARAASAWLSALAPIAAWVRSDAGPANADARSFWIEVSNLSGADVVLGGSGGGSGGDAGDRVRWGAGGAPSELVTLGAGETTTMPLRTPVADEPPGSALVALRRAWEGDEGVVNASGWRVSRRAIVRAMPVLPPGATIGPLWRDMDLSGWGRASLRPDSIRFPLEPDAQRAGELPTPEPAWTSAALLHRASGASTGGGGGAGGGGWTLYVECRHAPGTPLEGESVQVWFGPFGAPRAIVEFGPAREASIARTSPGSGLRIDPARGVTIVREAERWCAWIELPDDAFEDGDVAHIGLVRTDARAVRTSWPRPLLPTEREPGRITFDLSTWVDPAN